MEVRRSRQLRFPPFRLDRDDACLWRGTKAVRLTPKAFAVLQCLAERHGQLVTKDFLLESVWPETVVGDAVLKVCVREIRKAAIESARRASWRRFTAADIDSSPASPTPSPGQRETGRPSDRRSGPVPPAAASDTVARPTSSAASPRSTASREESKRRGAGHARSSS
ncbi:MAG: hypothetical protein DMD90_29670 [Candidatus Rokuibacteriota bacterium]|nr:MAG: hypothetical protein DMD90_29670 [Candidatus Rokubacteria bacterium]